MSESLLPYTACSSTTIGGPRRQASLEASPCEHRQDPVTINTLPDDVLVEIFHFHVDRRGNWTKEWHTLVHVCQRWRHVVFASPCRLNLRLEYRGNRPMSDILDVWPVLPVVMIHNFYESSKYWRNFSAALESEQHHHRICEITLSHIPEYYCDRLAAAMQKPFPGLTSLQFWLEDNVAMSLPDSFLGGSAPLLRHLILRRCPFPGISKLLLSANQLVLLRLWDIPDSGYISPQDLGTALSVMSKLETLHLEFRSPPYPASRPPTPLTRSVLPALTRLEFEGVHEYLEDLLAQIEAPLLNNLIVVFFRNLDFVLPQLRRLISQAEWFKTCDRATVRAWPSDIHLRIYRGIHHFPFLSLRVLCEELDSQLASLAQIRIVTQHAGKMSRNLNGWNSWPRSLL
ncbi:hypothetical protein F5148DRAFT_384477 [Russula earlei]|uniref:Uncharacterized protein n=1 Tax=Russula earlei TaxID=71964 RepID=A0ACC0U068_9AGAM|nr:hypothetical protein F5148DRAFT_384477 [Russula earlei]